MKQTLLVFLLVILPLISYSQCRTNTYIGTDIYTDKIALTVSSELDTSFILLSLKTSINNTPHFKARLGFKFGNNTVHAVVFLPIMNLKLSGENLSYNTPFNVEIRYRPVFYGARFLTLVGAELYTDRAYPYIGLSLPFK